MFMNKVEIAEPEPSLEDRLRAASAAVTEHVAHTRRREAEFADVRELSALQREHWRLLEIWSGLKSAVEREAQ